jgi:hypothetical protein
MVYLYPTSKKGSIVSNLVLTEQDLGVWFKLDGVAIKTQPQLDVALLSLATLYGLPIPDCQLELVYQVVHSTDHEEDLDDDLVIWLIAVSELAIKYLNNLANRAGYEFKFVGEDYENLTLYKLGNLPN